MVAVPLIKEVIVPGASPMGILSIKMSLDVFAHSIFSNVL